MNLEEFRDDLMNSVRARAEVDGDFTSAAFVNELAERLSDAEEIDNLTPVHFVGAGTNRRKLSVCGYDLDDGDGSVALAVLAFSGESDPADLRTSEATRIFDSLQNYLTDALTGAFQDGREESSPEYQLAEDLRRRGRNVSRYRLYLLTDRALSARAKDLPNADLAGIPVEYHVWDVARFHVLHEADRGREELTIDLTRWVDDGVKALKVSNGQGSTTTYLCALPGHLLAELYQQHGSRLLEGNVRSYLSARGKVNKGIKTTVMSEPERFLAYNNGITATATDVQLSSDGSILSLTDLQIVNGGQTSASLFYVNRDEREPRQMTDVDVQAKIVVVSPDKARELVPSISRFANSQNKVSEADFFSNSPFHVRVEELSRRTLAPARPGVAFQNKWFYERTRGQYLNEKNKLSTSEQKKFEATFPRSQMITKTDAAKYLVSWAQKPHKVSAGAQKNFVAFAEEVAGRWERSAGEFNEDYFKTLVAKAILFNTVRARVSKADWYESGYLANIVAYTVARFAQLVEEKGSSEYDFDKIWRRQEVPEATLNVCVDTIAPRVTRVLTSDSRPVVNVTEWAKKEECWNAVKAMPIEFPDELEADLVSASEARAQRKSARSQQRVDDGIQGQAAVLAVPAHEWVAMQQFAASRRLLSPSDAGILAYVTGARPGVPTEKQAQRLLAFRQRVIDGGYEYLGG